MTAGTRAALARLHADVAAHPAGVRVEIPPFSRDGSAQIRAIAWVCHVKVSVDFIPVALGNGHACWCLSLSCHGRLGGVAVDAHTYTALDGAA